MSSRVASWKLRQKRFNAIVGHQSVIMYWMLTMLNTRVLDAPIQHGFNMLCQHRLDSIQWYSTESIQHRLNIKSLQKVSFKCETTTSGHREKYQHQQPTPATTYTNNLHQQSTPTIYNYEPQEQFPFYIFCTGTCRLSALSSLSCSHYAPQWAEIIWKKRVYYNSEQHVKWSSYHPCCQDPQFHAGHQLVQNG